MFGFPLLGIIILLVAIVLCPLQSKITWTGMAMVIFGAILLVAGFLQIPKLSLEYGLQTLSLIFLLALTLFMMLSGIGFIFLGKELEEIKR